jgi:histone-binding protein RBBP4
MNIQDVSWNALKENVFASVGDDKQLMMSVSFPSFVIVPGTNKKTKYCLRWDTRDPSKSKPKLSIEAHETEILTVAFSPHNETLLLTGASDNVRLYPFPSL